MNQFQAAEPVSNLFSAIEILKLGWHVIPVYPVVDGLCGCMNSKCSSPAKHPMTRSGVKDATNDPNEVCQIWSKRPDANIGIATGAASGIMVIDIDPRHGGDRSWEDFTKTHDLPSTLQVSTGGGGKHIYFRTNGKKIPNKVGVLPGIDIRGDGGYVLAPPSVHISGNRYTWDNDCFENIPIVPDVILTMITGKARLKVIHSGYIKNGSRNATLTSVAGLFRRHGFDEGGVHKALTLLNNSLCDVPLETKEIVTIAKSIAKYEVPEQKNQPIWNEPKPLPEIKAIAPKMTSELVPTYMLPWVSDIADRMQIPLSFVTIPAVVSLASVIGRQIGIYPKQKDDWLVVPNLWGTVIARPGYFKTPAISEALKPLENLVKKARIKYEAECIVAQSKEDIVKAQIEGIKDNVKKAVRKGNQHEIDHLQHQLEEAIEELNSLSVNESRFKTNDATVEKIGALLLENPKGLLVHRDELSGWLKGMQKTGREGDREFYLEAWNGYGSYTVDRIGRGTLHIPSLCLSVFGGLQPGKLESYIAHAIAGNDGDDGLLQRFQLMVYPETDKKWKNIDRKPNQEAFHKIVSLFERLSEIKMSEVGAEDCEDKNVPGLHFDKEAQEVFNQWREKLEIRLRSDEIGTPALESHLSKYRSMVPSLALIFHLGSEDYNKGSVGMSSIDLAIKWADFLEGHAVKVYSSVIHNELKAAQSLAKKIKLGAVKDGDTVRAVYRKCWSGLETSKQVDKALGYLEDLGWLRVEQVKVTYRTKDAIKLNPKLKF